MNFKILISIILVMVIAIPSVIILTETNNIEAATVTTNPSLNLVMDIGGTDDGLAHTVISIEDNGVQELRANTSVISGNLPPGMSFSDRSTSSDGPNGYGATARFKLTGTATQGGTFVFTVRGEITIYSSGNVKQSQDCVVTVNVQSPNITVNNTINIALEFGSEDDAALHKVIDVEPKYSQELRANTSVISGNLPAGMSFSDRSTSSSGPDGYGATASFKLNGTATQLGTYVFTVRGEITRHSNGSIYQTTDCVVTVTVQYPQTTFNLSENYGYESSERKTLLNIEDNGVQELRANTSVISGNLPAGMSFSDRSTSSSGPDGYGAQARFELSGTPTEVGTYVFTVRGEITIYSSGNVKQGIDCVVTVTVQYRYCTVIFDANGGYVEPSSQTVIGSTQITLPTPTTSAERFIFKGWYTQSSGGTKIGDAGERYAVMDDQTIYAQWTDGITRWTNGNPNGLVSILFYIDQSNVTNEIDIQCPLYKNDPSIQDVFETEINESFVYTNKYLNINLNSIRSGTTNTVSITASLHNNDSSVISTSETAILGSWKTFIITIDTINAEVTYTKVMGFRSFTNFEETSTTGVVFSYSSLGDYNGQVTQDIKFIPETTTVPKQSIIKTSVFLNTYGIVLRDPSLDIATYFPEMTQMRLNFYSFALYGSSVTINGHTINVTAPNVTIYYTTNANGNIFSDTPGTNTKEKTLELTNIYITWDGENCYLTFADDDFTVDMGAYSDKVVSFAGMWYFATALWEPYTAQETTYDVDWFNFDFALFGIVFATMLLIASLILKVTIGAKFLDYIIIVCGVIIGLIIAGGSL